MKRFIILLVAGVLCFNLYGQTDTAYILTYGGIQNDVCNQIKPTYDGGYIMIGTTNSFGCGYTDFYAIKVDSLGHHQWSRTYGGSQIQEGFSVAATSDHGYAFLGFTDSYGAGGYDVFLVKTDSVGNEQWQRTYGGSNWDFGYSLKQLPDKGFVICGLTYSFGVGNGDVFIIRTDSNGATIWTQTAGGAGYDVGNSITVVNDSLYAIVGNTTSFGLGDTNVYFLLIDGKGNIKKDTTYGSTHSHIGNSINQTLDHGFVIFGATDSVQPGKPDEMMIKTDSVGDMQWMQVYHSGGYSIGHDAIQAPDGSYLAVSTSNSYGWGEYAMRVWHINAGGVPICGPSYGGAGEEQGISVAIAKNGNVAFVGSTNSQGYTEGVNDAYLVRMQNDSVINIVNYFTLPYYQFKDTCQCLPTPVSQVVFHPGIKVFPNPVSFSATILVQGQVDAYYSYNLYNEFGECIIKAVPLQATTHGQSVGYFEKGNHASGIYIYEICNKEGVLVATGKIIVD